MTRTMLAFTAGSVVLPLALVAGAERTADACGGCFAPPAAVTTVESHRMVVSLSPEQSVLWDQIQYSGNPADFVWVLPVPSAAAQIEIADSGFFDEMDSQTAPLVLAAPAPIQPCFGCCAAGASDSASADGGDVIVYNEDVVGPYETVTIGSQDANALQTWLTEHNYRVDPAAVPTIMHYVEQGSVFMVLRLAPGQGVQAMQPVRVAYPGYMATFPLKMVKIGASGLLQLSLWVIADQRYEAYNYENARVDPAALVYDWNDNTSNYDDVFRDTIDERGGRVWVTELAAPMDQLWFTDQATVARIRADIPVPYVTRLRTSTRVEYLDEDLILVPAEDPSPVPRGLTAATEIDRPFGYQDDEGCSVRRNPSAHIAMIALVGLSAVAFWRRRRRRPRWA